MKKNLVVFLFIDLLFFNFFVNFVVTLLCLINKALTLIAVRAYRIRIELVYSSNINGLRHPA